MLQIAKRGVIRALDFAGYELRKRPVASSLEIDYQALSASLQATVKFADLDPEFLPLMERVRAFTMTSVERMFALYKAVQYIARARIPGDLLECGVWRGGSMMLAAVTLLAAADTSRKLYLFDTFDGHPSPDPAHDIDIYGNTVADGATERRSPESSDWARVSIEEVRANLESTGYPRENILLVKGMVEKTAMANVPQALSLLRIDTDWYAPSKAALTAFWPSVSLNGVLIVDDYGHFPSQRRVVEEYFSASPILLQRIDHGCRVAVKPA
jgi:O-methyltransferase